MKRTERDIALDAIYEALSILATLADETKQQFWLTQSVHCGTIDSLARELGYPDAGAVYDSVDADRAQDAEMWRGVCDCDTW